MYRDSDPQVAEPCLNDLETQIRFAETRCDSLKQQLGYMKTLYNGVTLGTSSCKDSSLYAEVDGIKRKNKRTRSNASSGRTGGRSQFNHEHPHPTFGTKNNVFNDNTINVNGTPQKTSRPSSKSVINNKPEVLSKFHREISSNRLPEGTIIKELDNGFIDCTIEDASERESAQKKSNDHKVASGAMPFQVDLPKPFMPLKGTNSKEFLSSSTRKNVDDKISGIMNKNSPSQLINKIISGLSENINVSSENLYLHNEISRDQENVTNQSDIGISAYKPSRKTSSNLNSNDIRKEEILSSLFLPSNHSNKSKYKHINKKVTSLAGNNSESDSESTVKITLDIKTFKNEDNTKLKPNKHKSVKQDNHSESTKKSFTIDKDRGDRINKKDWHSNSMKSPITKIPEKSTRPTNRYIPANLPSSKLKTIEEMTSSGTNSKRRKNKSAKTIKKNHSQNSLYIKNMEQTIPEPLAYEECKSFNEDEPFEVWRRRDVVELYNNSSTKMGRNTKNSKKTIDYSCENYSPPKKTRNPSIKTHLLSEKSSPGKNNNDVHKTKKTPLSRFKVREEVGNTPSINENSFKTGENSKTNKFGNASELEYQMSSSCPSHQHNCCNHQHQVNPNNFKNQNNLNFRGIPFVVGQSTSPTHNLGLNIQQVLSIIKTRKPQSAFNTPRRHNNFANGSETMKLRKSRTPVKIYCNTSRPASPLEDLDLKNNKRYMEGVSEQAVSNSMYSKGQTKEGLLEPKSSSTSCQGDQSAHADVSCHMPKDVPNNPKKTLKSGKQRLMRAKTSMSSGREVDYQGLFSNLLNSGEQLSFLRNRYAMMYPNFYQNTGVNQPEYNMGGFGHGMGQSPVNASTGSSGDWLSAGSCMQTRGLKEVLRNLHAEFSKLHQRSEEMKAAGITRETLEEGSEKLKEVELLEGELQAKEDEINVVMYLFQEMTSLKGQVQDLKTKGFGSVTPSGSRRPVSTRITKTEIVEPPPATASVRLTKLLRTIQNFQTKLKQDTQ